MIDIKVPTGGESINEVTLVKWLKNDGDYVERDEVVAELESEKATFEVNAEKAGVLKTVGKEGDTLNIGDTLARIDETAAKPEGSSKPEVQTAKQEAPKKEEAKPQTQPASTTTTATDVKATPVASAIIADKKVDLKSIQPSGYNGKILKDDVLEALAHPGVKPGIQAFSRDEKKEKMSNLRKTVSRRLVEAKNTTAMLTTFNEVDMSKIMALRTQYKDKFKEKHGVGLGFMSFFTKAVCYALQEWPAVNAYIDGDSIVYHNYCDISIAVSAPKG
jgi:2-oxoglutarate dehydrogenase E2 component (dihydrolipoamide succinyltransferase)